MKCALANAIVNPQTKNPKARSQNVACANAWLNRHEAWGWSSTLLCVGGLKSTGDALRTNSIVSGVTAKSRTNASSKYRFDHDVVVSSQVARGTTISCPNADPEVAIDNADPRRFVNQPETSAVTLTGLTAASATAPN